MEDVDTPGLQIVRVCREFEKYTGGEAQLSCTINSKHAPDFHIHPALLADKFFARRKTFQHKLKKIVLTIETKEELLEYLDDAEVKFMLHHFGIQHVIEEMKKYNSEMETCTENIPEKIPEKIPERIQNAVQNTREKMQENKLSELQDMWSKVDKRVNNPSDCILFMLMMLKVLEQTTPRTLSVILHENESRITVGRCMAHDHQAWYEMLKRESLSSLRRRMLSLKQICKAFVSDAVSKRQINKICNELRPMAEGGIDKIHQAAERYQRKGLDNIARTFFNYDNCQLCHTMNPDMSCVNLGAELFAKEEDISSKSISSDHHVSKVVGVVKICITNNLTTRMKEMVTLAVGSAVCDELFIAKRLLQCSYRLCHGFVDIEAFFDELSNSYGLGSMGMSMLECVEAYGYYWWGLECKYCGYSSASSGGQTKPKACSGCMKVVYCSRKCQKKDWKRKHRRRCDMSWASIYEALKISILDRV